LRLTPNSKHQTPNLKRAEDGTRTRDLLITNQLLYQLSYFGDYTILELFNFTILLSKISKYKELSLFFGMAKVMENLIQQNFEKKIFNQFSTWFSTIAPKTGFRAKSGGS
jgi:hypothetical protein